MNGKSNKSRSQKALTPFSVLQTQDVADLAGQHEILIRAAHENSLIRQKDRKFLFVNDDTSKTEDEAKLPKEALSLSDFIKHAFLGSDYDTVETKRKSSAFEASQCRRNSQTSKLPALTGKKEQTLHTGTPEKDTRNIKSQPVPQNKSATCIWCRKMGRWCGWCRIPDIVRTRRGDLVVAEGYHRHLAQQHSASNKTFGNFSSNNLTNVGRSASSLGRLESTEQAQRSRLLITIDELSDGDSKFRRLSMFAESPKSGSKIKAPRVKPYHLVAESPSKRKGSMISIESNVPMPPLRRRRSSIDGRAKEELNGKSAQVTHVDPQVVEKNIKLLLQCKARIFNMLAEKDIRQLANMLQTRKYTPGEAVFQHGEKITAGRESQLVENKGKCLSGPCLFVVAEGVLFVYTSYVTDEIEEEVATLKRGSVFGEYSAVIGGRRCCTVRAAVPCVVLEIMKSHISAILYMIRQEQIQSERAEQTALQARCKAEQRLALAAQQKINALKAKEAKISEFKEIVEKRIFGCVLGTYERDREWKSGAKYRALNRELQSMLENVYSRQIQCAVLCMRARRKLQRLKKEAEDRLRAIIIIQRMFRGTLIRKKICREKKLHKRKPITGIAQAYSSRWVSEWLSNMNLKKKEAELRLQEEAAQELYYQHVQARVRENKLEQARQIFMAVQDSKVLGLTTFSIIQTLAVPKKALYRWLSRTPLIRKKKDHESEQDFACRAEKLAHILEAAVLRWFDDCPIALQIMAHWKNDVQGFAQSDAQQQTANQQRTRNLLRAENRGVTLAGTEENLETLALASEENALQCRDFCATTATL